MSDTNQDPNIAQRGAGAVVTPLEWRTDPDDPRNQAALAWTCDICAARIMHFCTNTIQPGEPLPGRVNHIARMIDRRREK
jgi:hypothetical protein